MVPFLGSASSFSASSRTFCSKFQQHRRGWVPNDGSRATGRHLGGGGGGWKTLFKNYGTTIKAGLFCINEQD
jgi:hypothetical protein